MMVIRMETDENQEPMSFTVLSGGRPVDGVASKGRVGRMSWVST